MRSLALTLVALPLVFTLAGPPAHAAAPPSDANIAAAKDHYKRASTLFDLGKYDDAIKEFEAAFELKDDPVFLYNIAQSYRLSNHYPEAIRFYRTYLKRSPKAKNKQEVEQRITEMEALVEVQKQISNAEPSDRMPSAVENAKRHPGGDKAANKSTKPQPTQLASSEHPAETKPQPVETHAEPTPAETTEPAETKPSAQTEASTNAEPEKAPEAATQPAAPEAPKPGRTKVIAGIALAVAGLAIAGGGVGLGMVAMSKAKDQEASPVYDPSIESQGKLFQNVGLALDVVGGAAAATGVILAVLGARENAKAAEHSVSVLPSARPGYAGATLNVRF
jgi:tetratricopeptide (TPR) repeat protein